MTAPIPDDIDPDVLGEAIVRLIRRAIDFVEIAAGEGIGIENEDQKPVTIWAEDIIMDFLVEMGGDEKWEERTGEQVAGYVARILRERAEAEKERMNVLE